ncbi:MAG: septum formation initiator family protein [Rickettsiales bacterium]|nr:septum formation initiator family protein [Rickettsiales bacterium]
MQRHLVRTTLRRLLFTAATAYLAFHSVQGEHGLYALLVQSHRKDMLHAELDKTRAEREKLEHRVSLLRPETLDRDLLDEQSRRYLGVVGKDEIVVTNE